MKILHTSDWHLGRTLYGRRRYDEFSQFLDWLAQTIQENEIGVLLVAGDVFDTSTPSNRAQQLYYQFLCRISVTPCRHVVIVAGNHDSPSFLNAPQELLRFLNVHVVGQMTPDPAGEVIVLQNDGGNPEAVVCAVPYLRDRDIRSVEAGESLEDKNSKLVSGVRGHYREVCLIAENKQARIEKESGVRVPILGMGHLFTAGGKTVDGDGVRELYVGSLAHVDKEIFPSSMDYLALGHLHVPQRVGGSEKIRYSGSPIPMGFGEANQDKKVIIADISTSSLKIEERIVPHFQTLVRITGSLDEIVEKIAQLRIEESTAWLEIEYTGSDIITNLRERIDEAVKGSLMEIRRIRNRMVLQRLIRSKQSGETLDDLTVGDVFERCLDAFGVDSNNRFELKNCYEEIVKDLHEEDTNAE